MKKLIVFIFIQFFCFLGFSQNDKKEIKIDFKKEIKPLLDLSEIEKAVPLLDKYFKQNLMIGYIWNPKVMLLESNNMYSAEGLLANFYDEKSMNNLSLNYADTALFWYNRMIIDNHKDSIQAKNRILFFKNASFEFEKIKQDKINAENQKNEAIRLKKLEEERQKNETIRLEQEQDKINAENQKNEAIRLKNLEEERQKNEAIRLQQEQDKINAENQKNETIRLQQEQVNINSENQKNEALRLKSLEEQRQILRAKDKDIVKSKKFLDDSGIAFIGNYEQVESIQFNRSTNWKKVCFIKGNAVCGKSHLLTKSLLKSEEKRSFSWKPLYRLSKKSSNCNGAISNVPTEIDINKALYLEIDERFILYRNKKNITACPICKPLTNEENSLGNAIENEFAKPKLVEQNNTFNEVKDIDGNFYKTIVIGNQEWFAENLKTTRYNDGTSIKQITNFKPGPNDVPDQPSFELWNNTRSAAWCFLENNASNNDKFGKLYNGYVVSITNNKNVCPEGWHVPLSNETTALIDYLGGFDVAGSKMKEKGNSNWVEMNKDANNLSLFTAIPSGSLWNDKWNSGGSWWCSSESIGDIMSYVKDCFSFSLSSYNSEVDMNSESKKSGLSVRCIKD
jgi:uncharacterized protein (TIGR02145 family)